MYLYQFVFGFSGLHDCSSESDSDDDTKPKPTEEARYSSSEESQPEQHVERSRDERVAERKSQMSLPIPNQKQTSDGNRSSMVETISISCDNFLVIRLSYRIDQLLLYFFYL